MKKILVAFTLLLAAFSSTCVQAKKPKLEKGLYAEIQTSRGKILIKLEFEKAPLTVANFVGLAEGKIKNSAKAEGVPYYDGLKFHRVIANFMIQGGDPQGNGTGGPGYSFKDEFVPEFRFSGPGILAMANSGPATNGSQFFITHKETPWLNDRHTIFGHLISGQDVVNAVQQNETIEKIKIIRKGRPAKKFKADKVFEELRNK
ncbi:MAG: peptidylprolyl isomerase [Bacteroidota bacterium]